MKPSELYKREVEKVDNKIEHLFGHYYNHVPEIHQFDEGYWIENDPTEDIEIHYFKDFCFDGRRTWTLAGVKFRGEWVMITQNAGREGDDHTARFVTNIEVYNNMLNHIQSLIVGDEEPLTHQVDVDVDIEGLGSFYSNSLDGVFKRF